MTSLSPEVADDILSHLLNILEYPPQERHRRRYGMLVEGNEAALRQYLLSCIRPEIFQFFNQPELPSWASLRKMNEGVPAPPDVPGVYLNIVRGTDGYDRLYVGQASKLHQRIFKQHMNFRYRRDNRTLHYHAMEYSIWNNFITLAILPPPTGSLPPWLRGDKTDLLLNILEMWCALMFKTLPRTTLEDWIPERYLASPDDEQWFPLNLALPLDQGDHSADPSVNWGEALRSSNDNLARGYSQGHTPRAIPRPTKPLEPGNKPQLHIGKVVAVTFAAGFIAGSMWQRMYR